MSNPCVSVILAVYNGANYLRETIDSILAQDYAPFELIAVDDSSKDNSVEILQSYGDRLILIQQPNQGVAGARNTGLSHAKGKYITFMDQDDLWSYDKLSQQVAYMEAHPEFDYVLSRVTFFLQPGVERPSWLKPQLLQGDYPGYHMSSMLARRTVFDRVGLLSTDYRYSDDVDWFFRAKDIGISMQHLPHIALHRRVHGDNNSAAVTKIQRELLAIAGKSIKTQRMKQAC